MKPIEVITKAEAKARGFKPLTAKLARNLKADNALFEDTVARVSADPTARLASVEDLTTRQLWRNPHPRHVTSAASHRAVVVAGPTSCKNQRRSKPAKSTP